MLTLFGQDFPDQTDFPEHVDLRYVSNYQTVPERVRFTGLPDSYEVVTSLTGVNAQTRLIHPEFLPRGSCALDYLGRVGMLHFDAVGLGYHRRESPIDAPVWH